MRGVVSVCLVLLVLVGCARRPDAIPPVAVPVDAYMMMECDQLRLLLGSERSNLNVLSAQQSNAATGDAVGVFLIGVPMSSLTGGDQEGNIAVSKGKIQAMESALLARGCPGWVSSGVAP